MLFFIFCALVIAGIVIHEVRGWEDCFGEVLAVVFGIVVGISLICMICDYSTQDATIAANKQRYGGITYEISSGIYANDYNISTANVIDKARKWNEDLASNKLMQRNFWIGIYIPNIYDNFQYIDYNSITNTK